MLLDVSDAKTSERSKDGRREMKHSSTNEQQLFCCSKSRPTSNIVFKIHKIDIHHLSLTFNIISAFKNE